MPLWTFGVQLTLNAPWIILFLLSHDTSYIGLPLGESLPEVWFKMFMQPRSKLVIIRLAAVRVIEGFYTQEIGV